MLAARVYPDAPIYNAVILGYARIGDAKTAFKRFNDVSKEATISTAVLEIFVIETFS